MDTVDPYLSLVDTVLTLCSAVYRMAQKVKANKQHCHNVQERVELIRDVVEHIQYGHAGVERALLDLCRTLTSAMTLMEKFYRANAVMSFLKSGSYEDKFYQVDKTLTENLQVLNVALQTEHGNMLRRVYKTVSRGSSRPKAPTPQPNMTNSPKAPPYEAAVTPPYPTTTPYPMPYVQTSSPTAQPFEATTVPPYPTTTPFPMPYVPANSPMAQPFEATTVPPYPTTTPFPMPCVPLSGPVAPINFQGNMSMCSPAPVSYAMPSMPMPSTMWSPFSSTVVTNSAPMTFTTMNGADFGSTFIFF